MGPLSSPPCEKYHDRPCELPSTTMSTVSGSNPLSSEFLSANQSSEQQSDQLFDLGPHIERSSRLYRYVDGYHHREARMHVSKTQSTKVGSLLTWSTGFIATPRVLGQELRLTANLCFARDASVKTLAMSQPLEITQQHTQHWLVCSTAACDDSDHSSSTAGYNFLCATW